MKNKLFDIDDLHELRSVLQALAGYAEWDYPLSYQRSIDDVIHLLNDMINDNASHTHAKGSNQAIKG